MRALGDAPSGTALIVVDAAGENSIVVVPGANARLSAADVERAIDGPSRSCSPSSRSPRTLSWPPRAPRPPRAQREPGAPAARGAARGRRSADRQRRRSGEITGADEPDARALAAAAHAIGARSIVITLGARGACWSAPEGTVERPAPAAEVVDTTGAGDVFAGTLAARLARARSGGRARGRRRRRRRRRRLAWSAGAAMSAAARPGALPGGLAAAAVFAASGAVLVLEILGIRLLAPYVGLTLETYTTIIGVVLAGIALGAATGRPCRGRARAAPPARALLIAGGLLALATVPLVRVFGEAFEGSGQARALAIALFALLPPATVLSAVTPVVVKLQLGDLGGERHGRRAALGVGDGRRARRHVLHRLRARAAAARDARP